MTDIPRDSAKTVDLFVMVNSRDPNWCGVGKVTVRLYWQLRFLGYPVRPYPRHPGPPKLRFGMTAPQKHTNQTPFTSGGMTGCRSGYDMKGPKRWCLTRVFSDSMDFLSPHRWVSHTSPLRIWARNCSFQGITWEYTKKSNPRKWGGIGSPKTSGFRLEWVYQDS